MRANKLQSTDNKSTLDDLYNKIAGLKKDFWVLYKEYKKIMQGLSKAQGKTPMSKVGKVITEYAENLKKAEERVHALYKELDYNYDYNLKDVENNLKYINSTIGIMNNDKSLASNSLLNKNSANSVVKKTTTNYNSETKQNTKNGSDNPNSKNTEWAGGKQYMTANISVRHGACFQTNAFAVPENKYRHEINGELKKYFLSSSYWKNKLGLKDDQQLSIDVYGKDQQFPEEKTYQSYETVNDMVLREFKVRIFNHLHYSSPGDGYVEMQYMLIKYNNGTFEAEISPLIPIDKNYHEVSKENFVKPNANDKIGNEYEGAGNVK